MVVYCAQCLAKVGQLDSIKQHRNFSQKNTCFIAYTKPFADTHTIPTIRK